MSYVPAEYWDERCRRIGHTGDTNPLIYAYDQPLRLTALAAALERINCRLDCRSVLDVGCGSGDMVSFCLARGARAVTAIDCATAVIDRARERFQAQDGRLTLAAAAIEDADYPAGSFDLSICFNVLQHVVDESRFMRAVLNLVRMSVTGGYILVCEHLSTARERQPGDYVVVRTKQSYVDAFNIEGCLFRTELGLPRLGVRACRAVARGGARVLGSRSRSGARPAEPPEVIAGRLRRVYRMMCQGLLAAAGPLDHALFPFPSRWTDMSILIFEKRPTTR